ncbi:iron ABC transporter substrate-binding protein [Methanobrevibacter filiformis]|uniref:Vitamin B12-binding protein n=1 Tax=Methanobrevibacter filiformis TaxID=55758 RepID=A0A166DB19_9EURY|nr:iron ABC transporter substrate-binding protein [Methanobrevibacter filiformis]KZX15398.1 vitamin B12-binding protein [Methanobrevibacter filiformis]
MKAKTILPLIGILLILGVIFTYYSVENVSPEGDMTINDMVGRTITVPKVTEKIIATSPPMTTLVYILDPDLIVGLNYEWTPEELTHIPSKYKNITVVGGWYGRQDGDYEEMLKVNPDIIIETGMGDVDKSDVDLRQEQFGKIPVVGVLDTSNLTEIDSSIEFMGKLLKKEDKANKLIEFKKKYYDKVEDVTSSIPDSDKRKVYYAEGPDGLKTDPSGTYHSQLIDICGGINVADIPVQEGVGEVPVTMEQVIKWNPDVIITTDANFYNNTYNNPNWKDVKAIKNKEVYLSPSSPFNWFDRPPGANCIIGIPWTAKVLYPYKFNDVNLKEITKEFYSEFYHYELNDEEVKNILKNSGLKDF